MQLGLGWIFVGAYAVENGRSIDIALLRATSLYVAYARLYVACARAVRCIHAGCTLHTRGCTLHTRPNKLRMQSNHNVPSLRVHGVRMQRRGPY